MIAFSLLLLVAFSLVLPLIVQLLHLESFGLAAPSEPTRTRDLHTCQLTYAGHSLNGISTTICKMPWSRTRANRPGDLGSLRRHSTIDTTILDQHNEPTKPNAANHLGSDTIEAVKLPSPLRNSFEPPEEEQDAVTRDRPRSPVAREHIPNRQRFSMLKFRHASDPQISKTARDQSLATRPPMPAGKLWRSIGSMIKTLQTNPYDPVAPAIITTAPTESLDGTHKKKSAFTLPRRQKAPDPPRPLSAKPSKQSLLEKGSSSGQNTGGPTSANPSAGASRVTFDEPEKLRASAAPPAYGDDSNSSLALPVSRLSESSRSEGSLGDHGVYATTTTTHTVSTTTTFFRLPRRKKNKGPLFPLPVKVQTQDLPQSSSFTPRVSTGARPSNSPHHSIRPSHDSESAPPLPSPSHGLSGPGGKDRSDHTPPEKSSPTLADPMHLGRRGRSSTKGSLRQSADEDPLPTPPLPQSGRTSSSTTGRASLGGLFTLSRLRQNSEPQQFQHGSNHPPMPGTPISIGSKQPSLSLNRDPIVVPERQEGDTPAKYLMRLEEAVSRGAVATILSQSNDDFFKNVLRSYMRGFKFFGDPLDMSTRKLLMEVELPKETQQIDRVLQAFANRYHECNPGVYASPDEAYFIAFSILILHTDAFNKNNKHKMQKHDYTKNARGQGVADEILECFYDNISYTPFIHVDDDVDINGERIVARKSKKNIFAKTSTDSTGKASREPVDPYTLILDNRLDSLRPSLKDVMNLDDHYTYLGTAPSLNLANLHKTFFKSGILQIVSSRSRPEAFMSPETMANPAEAHPGVVDIKITKVGILWRKDMKKKKARSPWQEWGAILTGAQLYFFRNTAWIKSLMHQHDSHHKHGYAGAPVIFKPPLEQFKPDVLTSTENAVALLDLNYKKHKHALVFIRHGGFEETFLADSELEMNDWLAKLNYASAFRTAGVRMRGIIGGTTDGQKTRAMRRIDSSTSTHSSQIAVDEAPTQHIKADVELAHQIQAARREIIAQKISEADGKLSEAAKHLETQLRNARHLQILAPIQNRTREQILLAAGGMAAKIKWMRMENWRTRCHRDILAMDLEEDMKSGGERAWKSDKIQSSAVRSASPGNLDAKKMESLEAPSATPQATPRAEARPSTQPTPTKPFSMDDVFQSIQPSSQSIHRSKGSWELPPLSFQPTRSSIQSGYSLGTAQTRRPLVPQPSSRSVSDGAKVSDTSNIVSQLTSPGLAIDDEEQGVLQEAGLVEPESPSATKTRSPETPNGSKERAQEKSKSLETEVNEAKSKVRRSLHRTLRESHPPSHHRSKKGKDSAGSAGGTEDSSSMADSEGLARGTGSFTVHGKKASVINFGSEWQTMSPEERLKLRKQAQGDDSKLSVPSAIEDEDSSLRSAYKPMARPVSAVSASTTTQSSAPYEEAVEEPGDSTKLEDDAPT